jgi:hypothetical protein
MSSTYRRRRQRHDRVVQVLQVEGILVLFVLVVVGDLDGGLARRERSLQGPVGEGVRRGPSERTGRHLHCGAFTASSMFHRG